MVTFALPGDEAAESASTTPKPRPGLAFSQRGYGASPYGSVNKRPGSTPLSRKSFVARSEPPASSLNRSFAGQRNIFRSSTIADSPPNSTFSPSLPQSTMKRVFAPGATPEPSRVQRDSPIQSASRGVAAKAKDKDLFPMRISSPPPELTGEALAQKVPKDWDPKGSIYADQFLGHLCPAELDEDQRRQFFCILDLRRLKYAADEIFVKKGWKLNVMNFAKEFEKSRSIILLRYGLYEFQNVKPSKEILKRWRREHGLAEPEDEQEPTPTKTASKKKRKVSDDDATFTPAPKAKKRAAEGDDSASAPKPIASAPPTAAPTNKRKASASDETESQPSKLQKPTSGARSMFEKAANKVTTTPSAAPPKSNLFSNNKPAANDLFRSVLTANTEAAQANGNIFGHLSDSSAKNSGDADEDSGSESEESPEPAAAQVDEPRAKRPALASAVDSGMSSDAGTRESTPGRSLFERVSKDDEGQLVRAATPVESSTTTTTPAAPALKDQTWNPGAAPLKFGPSTSTPQISAFSSAATSTPSTPGLFAPKPSATTSLFGGASKPAEEKEASEKSVADAPKKTTESDKEDKLSTTEKPTAETKAPAFGSLFGTKSTTAEAVKDTPSPATSLFSAPASTTASNIFGAAKPTSDSASTAAAPALSSTLFGNKSTEPAKEPEKPLVTEAPKATPGLGGFSTDGEKKAVSSMFSNMPATNAGSVFTAPSSAAPAKPLFGSQTSTNGTSAPALPAPAAPSFSFGAGGNIASSNSLQETPKPSFGAPKSPPAATGNSMVDGSPMKQDDKSPAKPLFGATNSSVTPSSAPIFSFSSAGAGTTPSVASGASGSIFGAASNPTTNNGGSGSLNFGATSTNQPSVGFNFGAGGGDKADGNAFNNPFASGNGGQSSSVGAFNFGASTTPASGPAPFQFGGTNGTNAGTPATGLFGANQGNTNGATPAFGGSSAPGGSSMFNFGASSSQPQQGTPFGSNQNLFNLQPPTGGPSTGTNTPFSLGGGSSLATTPARGTPEPSAKSEAAKTETAKANEEEDGEKHEQINLTEAVEEGEESLHEVRAKVLKFIPAEKSKEGEEEKPKAKSPWSTQGVGPLRILQNKESKAVRLLLRAEPRGHVAFNRSVLPDLEYKADNKYVKITTSNETGDGLETWMVQVKTKELATELAEALEKHKLANKK